MLDSFINIFQILSSYVIFVWSVNMLQLFRWWTTIFLVWVARFFTENIIVIFRLYWNKNYNYRLTIIIRLCKLPCLIEMEWKAALSVYIHFLKIDTWQYFDPVPLSVQLLFVVKNYIYMFVIQILFGCNTRLAFIATILKIVSNWIFLGRTFIKISDEIVATSDSLFYYLIISEINLDKIQSVLLNRYSHIKTYNPILYWKQEAEMLGTHQPCFGLIIYY